MPQAEVVVVGAGPAGVAAAITLAQAGRHVVLIDKATFPRDKCCGDGLTTAALRELEALGFDPATVPSWQVVHDIHLVGPTQRAIALTLPKENGQYAVVAQRQDLDAALVALARQQGVDVREGQALTDAHMHHDHVALTLNDRDVVTARYAIGADGMWSPLRRALGAGLESYRGDWHAFRQYFSNVSDRASRELAIFFDADLLPCYAWSFPLPGNRANVGFGLLRGAHLVGADMRRLWDELPHRPHIAAFLGADAVAEDTHRAWPIPARFPGPALTHRRALFVGDAAALGDPMTGEGVAQALASGRAAAQAIIEAGPHDAFDAARRYTTWVEGGLAIDTTLSAFLMRALAHRKGVRAAMALVDVHPWARRNFARWLFEDEPRAALATPHRMHRRFLQRPGAYRTFSASTMTAGET